MDENRSTMRIHQELKRMEKCPPKGILLWSVDSNFDTLEAIIDGPIQSPYEGGEFKLGITIPKKYPIVPPVVKFITPIYHPNIDKSGRICLESLKQEPQGKWSPTNTLESILIQIQILMAEPNHIDPLEREIANQFVQDRPLFDTIAKEWTEKHAKNTKLGMKFNTNTDTIKEADIYY